MKSVISFACLFLFFSTLAFSETTVVTPVPQPEPTVTADEQDDEPNVMTTETKRDKWPKLINVWQAIPAGIQYLTQNSKFINCETSKDGDVVMVTLEQNQSYKTLSEEDVTDVKRCRVKRGTLGKVESIVRNTNNCVVNVNFGGALDDKGCIVSFPSSKNKNPGKQKVRELKKIERSTLIKCPGLDDETLDALTN